MINELLLQIDPCNTIDGSALHIMLAKSFYATMTKHASHASGGQQPAHEGDDSYAS